MKRLIALLALLSTLLVITACNDKKNNIKPPHALSEITASVPVEELWNARIGRGAHHSGVRMRPAVADGRVYAASIDGEIAAFDAATGRTLWRQQRQWRDTGDRGYSGGPSVLGDALAIGTRDGKLLLLNATTGAQQWEAKLGSSIISAPVFADGLVLARTEDGNITALKQTDGSRAWRYDRGIVPALSLRGNGGLTVRQGVVFFGSDDGKLVAIRLDNGSPLWEHVAASGEGRTEIQQLADADGTPLVQGTTVYLGGYQGDLIAVEGPTGRPLWSHPFSTYSGLASGGTSLIGVDAESNVWAFDDSTGSDLWKQDGLSWRWLSAPAIMGSYVVVGDAAGYVHWLDLADGKFVARMRPSHDAIRAQPVVIDANTVIVEDSQGGITAFRVGTTKS
ncbi:MAG TPA: outer membrane protein assembly factor BamB [Rhodanobacteraceae bacterium]|nr:outer membrane protein assembly factor BamB [Rhodanobacteraceae bacterium]